MATYEGAVARIAYLLGSGPYRATPTTLSLKICRTGHPDHPFGAAIRSYAMTIGREVQPGLWEILDGGSTMTTNRHMRALGMALDKLGIHYVVVDDLP